MKTKIFLSLFLLLLLIASGVLGYHCYSQHQELEARNVGISRLEVQIRDLRREIQELNNLNIFLQQEKKDLSDTIAAKDERIEQLEKFIAENKLKIPAQTAKLESRAADTSAEAESDADAEDVATAADHDADSSILWYWIIFAVVLLMAVAAIAICKKRKKETQDECKNKKFICPSCGWKYNSPVTQCENCKTRF